MTTITALMDPSKMPNQSQDQATFDANWAYVLENMGLRGQQENALAANLNSIAAGGAYAIPYTYDTGTGYADPGAGKLRLNNLTAGSATGLFANSTSSAGSAVADYLASANGSTSAVKGHFRLTSFANPNKYVIFSVTSVDSSSAAFRAFGVTFVSGSGGNFVSGEPVVLHFQRTGDKGDTGPLNSYPAMYVQETLGSTSSPTYAVGSWVTRSLNSVRSNTISGASLSSNAVTLPAGTYDYEAYVSGYNSQFQCRFLNVTDATTLENGSSEYVSGSSVTTKSFVKGRITISATKTFRVEVYFTSGGGGGYTAGNGSGIPSVFSELKIIKVA